MVYKIVRGGIDMEGKTGVLVGWMHGWFGVFISLGGIRAILTSNFWDRFPNDLMIGFRRSLISEIFDKCYLH